jgi:hypothetical protein
MKQGLKTPLLKNSVFVITILVIILFSFFHHSSLYSPFLNSDDAVLVLMIRDFHLPQDLYYWGANRGGALIPLIGQFFFQIVHLSAIESESVTRYLILVAGYLGLISLFRVRFTKIIFAIVWFLPPLRMVDVIKLGFGQQYALIGISIFFINHIYSQSIEKYHFKQYMYLFLITIFFILSIWVSDLAVVTVFIILCVHVITYLKNNKTNFSRLFTGKPELYYMTLGLIAGGLFIYLAKSSSLSVENYYGFLNLKMMTDSFKIFIKTIADLFLFKMKEPFTSLYLYLLVVALFFVVFKRRYIRLTKYQSKWVAVFSLDLAIVFLIILASTWTYINGVPRRYFVCNYVSFWMAFLLTFESLKEIKYHRLFYILLFTTVLTGGLGTIYNYRYISPKRLTPTVRTVSEFEKLGNIGIIAEYWNSYLSSISNPAMIKATPNDMSEIRNQRLVDSVFAQPALYIIRDMWMDSFPDTLEQFGYMLSKAGDEFRIGGCQVCRYQKIKLNKFFGQDKFMYNGSLTYNDTTLGTVRYVTSDCDSCMEMYFVYGPYIPIGIGNFTARFYLKASNITSADPFALLDVVADYGTVQLHKGKIDRTIFTDGNFRYADLNFETKKRYSNLEFRIYFYGHADLYFSHVELKEK